MVTNLKEGTKTKCQQYWPDTSSTSYGPFEVTITDSQLFADYVMRTFQVSVSASNFSHLSFKFLHIIFMSQLAGSSSRSLKVTQYHFTAWPDHGVPDYATPILAFHRRVISQHKSSHGPMLVHCRWAWLHVVLRCVYELKLVCLVPVLVLGVLGRSSALTWCWSR